MALTKALGGGGGGSIAVQEEGATTTAAATTVNFVGAGVTATDVGGVATVTIPGGGSGVEVQEEGVQTTAAAATLNFVGAGVTTTDVAGVATITVPGASTPAEVLITETVLGAGAATFSFAAITASYRDLRVVVRGRGTAGAAFCRPRLQVNGDTGNNYDWQRHYATGTSTPTAEGGGTYGGAGVAFVDIGLLPAGTATAGLSGVAECRIYNYRGTTFHKPMLANSYGYAAARFVLNGGGLWKSTAAITSITLLLDAGNYDTGTVASLYGIL
jgi:hypothetical protein